MVLPGRGGSVVLMCLSFTLAAGSLPPPENLSLSWDPNSLSVIVNWREPAGLNTTCKVNYTVAIYYEKCPPRHPGSVKWRTKNLSLEHTIAKECEICAGISTNPMNCGKTHASEEVFKDLRPPLALVKNFSCAYYGDKKMNCTWTKVRNPPDLQLFYREEKENTLKHCMSYLTYENMKTGCHLRDKNLTADAKVYFVINGTEGNDLIENRFIIDIRISVRPPQPKVYILQEGERLHFNASIPRFIKPQCLRYKYIYSKCNEKSKVVEASNYPTVHVEYDIACKYTIRGQVIYSKDCGGDEDIESDMSEPVYYGEDCDPNLAFKVAMIITPLIVCCCLVAAIMLFRRNKDIILPKIPEPSLFFKDMLNSTSDGLSKSLGGGRLYVPVKEVVASAVSLEPKSALLYPNHDPCI